MKTNLAISTIAAAISLVTATLTSPASASEYTKGNIKVSTPWTRATPGGAMVAGGFMTITNTGKEADRLIGGSVPFAGSFEVHEMTMQDNVMRMRMLPRGLEIPPGATVELRPGSYHVMFMDLKAPVRKGEPIKGTLLFEKAGSVAVEYGVAGVGAPSFDSGAAGMKGHGGMGGAMKH